MEKEVSSSSTIDRAFCLLCFLLLERLESGLTLFGYAYYFTLLLDFVLII